MAKTLLNGVNAVLGGVESLDSDSELTTLEDTARQTWIDNAVRALNLVLDDLYDLSPDPAPNVLGAGDLTLVENDQDYTLNSELIVLRPEYELIDRTNSHTIVLDKDGDGYRKILHGDIEQDDTGTPSFAAISPIDGQLVLDRKPDAQTAGRVYRYYYEKELGLSAAADQFPFNDTVYRAVVEAATELYQRRNHRDWDLSVYNKWLAVAASRLNLLPRRKATRDNRATSHQTDPFEPA